MSLFHSVEEKRKLIYINPPIHSIIFQFLFKSNFFLYEEIENTFIKYILFYPQPLTTFQKVVEYDLRIIGNDFQFNRTYSLYVGMTLSESNNLLLLDIRSVYCLYTNVNVLTRDYSGVHCSDAPPVQCSQSLPGCHGRGLGR